MALRAGLGHTQWASDEHPLPHPAGKEREGTTSGLHVVLWSGHREGRLWAPARVPVSRSL